MMLKNSKGLCNLIIIPPKLPVTRYLYCLTNYLGNTLSLIKLDKLIVLIENDRNTINLFLTLNYSSEKFSVTVYSKSVFLPLLCAFWFLATLRRNKGLNQAVLSSVHAALCAWHGCFAKPLIVMTTSIQVCFFLCWLLGIGTAIS